MYTSLEIKIPQVVKESNGEMASRSHWNCTDREKSKRFFMLYQRNFHVEFIHRFSTFITPSTSYRFDPVEVTRNIQLLSYITYANIYDFKYSIIKKLHSNLNHSCMIIALKAMHMVFCVYSSWFHISKFLRTQNSYIYIEFHWHLVMGN